MTRIVEADEKGAVHLDRELLGSKPGAQYIVNSSADQVVLRPVAESATKTMRQWNDRTPAERAAQFEEILREFRELPGGPSLSDEALRRENMYD